MYSLPDNTEICNANVTENGVTDATLVNSHIFRGKVDRSPHVGGVRSQFVKFNHHVDRQKWVPAKIEMYVDGTYCKVTSERRYLQCLKCGNHHWTFQRDGVETATCRKCSNAYGTRTAISHFSAGSRRRLLDALNKTHRDLEPLFVTLTYSDAAYEYTRDAENFKRDLDVFAHRLTYHFPDASAPWKLEMTDRKSGDYVGELFPHYHLLVYGVRESEMRQFVRDAWHDIAGHGDIEHAAVLERRATVKKVVSRRGIIRYASKGLGNVIDAEMAKSRQTTFGNVGRYWGIINRRAFDELYTSAVEVIDIAQEYAVDLIRLFKRKTRTTFNVRALRAYISGQWMRDRLADILFGTDDRTYAATNRPFDTPFYQWRLDCESGV